jgi:hypothetical protein
MILNITKSLSKHLSSLISMETQNPQPNLPKHTHKILWSVAGFLLLVVIIGSAVWWQEIKKTQLTNNFVPHYDSKLGCYWSAEDLCGGSEENYINNNWKTYTNTEYGFEFKYPSNYLFEIEDAETFGNDIVFLVSTEGFKEDGSHFKTTVSVSDAPFDNFSEIKSDSDLIALDETRETINGVDWNIISLESKAHKNKFTLAVTTKNDWGYSVTSDQGKDNQILSTFKFTK